METWACWHLGWDTGFWTLLSLHLHPHSSSKVQVEGESPQWVIVHHLLVLAVTQGKAVTGNLSPSRTTCKGEICNSRVIQTGHMFPKVASEGIN